MLNDFIFSANAVFPIFIIIGFGYILRQKIFLSPEGINDMNKLVFHFALPAVLFRNIYTADFNALFNPTLMTWIVVSILLTYVGMWIFAEVYLRKRKELISSFVQAAYRSNYAIVGLPIVANIMGENNTGLAALSAAFIVTSFNILAVIVLVSKNTEGGGLSLNLFKSIVLGIFKNPLIIAIALGAALNLSPLSLPHIVRESMWSMASLGTTLALIAVGGSMKFSEVRNFVQPVILSTVMKIVIMPTFVVVTSVLLGFRGEELAVLFVMSASPTAVASYIMAEKMGGSGAFTSTVILMATVFSSVTLTIGVYLIRMLGLL